MPGPVPNRSDDLARPRTRKGSDQVPVTKGVARETFIPEPDPEWHPIALMVWESLATSGQSDFYQQSDWAIAWSICEDLSYYKTPQTIWSTKSEREYSKPRSGQMLQTIMSALSNLLVTEADRRRVRIELQEPEGEKTPLEVVVMDDYRKGLGLTED